LRLMYSGSLYGERELWIFLEGLRRLVDDSPEFRNRLEVELVGWISSHNRAIADWYASSGGLAGMIHLTGFVSHAEALERLKSADAALHLLADDPGKELFVAGKVFEYIGLSMPTLAVLPQGDARTILERLGWGIVVDPDPDQVATGLRQLMASPPQEGPADPEGLYDRANLSRELAALLSATVERASGA
jgi:glycosyltransferase involved in cell wall biosynthesis